MIIKYKRLYYLLISLFIFFGDQISKYLISINFNSIIGKDIFIFKFDLVKNYGAAFNLLNGNRLILSSISILILIVLTYYILIANNKVKLELISCSFILAGTAGNGIDRITKGYVIDFINLNIINFPVFNLADIAINIGFVLFLYSLIRNQK